MTKLRLLAVGMMALALTVTANAADNKEPGDKGKLLVGKWEVTKSSQDLPPVGAVYEFTKDGKLNITARIDGVEKTMNGVYTVEGDKVQITLKRGDKEEKKDPLTIKTISETELILEAKGGATFEHKRTK